jgi:hypothetical protein
MRCALLLTVAAALASAATATAAPLVPRELASLSESSHALVRLDGRRGEGSVRAAGGVLVAPRLAIWRLPSAAAQRLVPRLAVEGALLEFERELPRRRLVAAARSDPLVPEQWWLPAVGADRVEPPGPGKLLTVVDSGIDAAHPEFAGRPDLRLLNEQRLAPQESEFHGTAVASVAAAPRNGVGIEGIYPAAALASWDVTPQSSISSGLVIAGISAAAGLGPGVINLSIGGDERSPLEELTVRDAVARGSIVVAASGNDRDRGDRPNFPASLPHVFTVGAVGPSGAVSPFSSTSAGMDVVAPGEDVIAAVPGFVAAGGFAYVDGTSFASPIAAAALAWVWTARPELDASQVFELVRRSAVDLETPGRDRSSGFGLLDLPAALAAPAPSRDPFEPNDTVSEARGAQVPWAARPALTAPGRGRATVTARLDAADDPQDVYPVWVPANRRVIATVRPAGAGVVARVLGTLPRNVASVRTRTTLEVRNRTRAGRLVYVAASLGSGSAAYTLTLTTAAVPR